jgi:hypothetical protein
MQDKEEIIRSLTNHYSSQVMRAFGNVDPASKALEVIAKSLKEIYRFFEPAFFTGHFVVCKDLADKVCLENAILLYDKNILLNRTVGTIVIQVFDDGKMLLLENVDITGIYSKHNLLIYNYENNQESFFANENQIDITIYNKGSRFATQFNDLYEALHLYSVKKVLKSSCPHFHQSWADPNRIFFRGAGSGNNIPEKFMQLSLLEYLSTKLDRGITIDSSREYNILGDFKKPKPVDVKIHWREANRTAIIEIKFVGIVKKDADGEIYSYNDRRANSGIVQLKGYYDQVSSDSPTTIIRSYLVVIDGRRNNVDKDRATIDVNDGMHYKNIDLNVDADKSYHQTIVGFEKPIRMFAEPICV